MYHVYSIHGFMIHETDDLEQAKAYEQAYYIYANGILLQ
jgi:hypothetical protein